MTAAKFAESSSHRRSIVHGCSIAIYFHIVLRGPLVGYTTGPLRGARAEPKTAAVADEGAAGILARQQPGPACGFLHAAGDCRGAARGRRDAGVSKRPAALAPGGS